jgi:hypothetical protein
MQVHFTELERTSAESMRRTRESVKLAAAEMGIHMERSLTGIIARRATLGPALHQRFEATAALAFAA